MHPSLPPPVLLTLLFSVGRVYQAALCRKLLNWSNFKKLQNKLPREEKTTTKKTQSIISFGVSVFVYFNIYASTKWWSTWCTHKQQQGSRDTAQGFQKAAAATLLTASVLQPQARLPRELHFVGTHISSEVWSEQNACTEQRRGVGYSNYTTPSSSLNIGHAWKHMQVTWLSLSWHWVQ